MITARQVLCVQRDRCMAWMAFVMVFRFRQTCQSQAQGLVQKEGRPSIALGNRNGGEVANSTGKSPEKTGIVVAGLCMHVSVYVL